MAGHPSLPAPPAPRLPAVKAWLLLAALSLVLGGCAAPQPLLKRGKGGPQWPEQPYAAQVEWVKTVSSPEDAGIGKSFWKRAVEVFTGPEEKKIVKPYGVLYDDGGRLIVADPGAGAVHIMDTKANRYSRIPAEGGVLFTSPIGVAEDAAGRLYISDSGANTVYRYDLASQTLTPFLRQLERPTGIAYNRVNGLLYISETAAHRVIAVDEKGTVKHAFGERGEPGFLPLNLPTDLTTDARGQVYVNDPLNYKIRIFTAEGLPVSEFGAMGDAPGELNKPKGIAVDAEGHIYLADGMLDTVEIFNESGQLLFSFGANGTDDGGFWMPSGLAINGSHIFVADTYNQRVQVFRRIHSDSDPSEGDADKAEESAR